MTSTISMHTVPRIHRESPTPIHTSISRYSMLIRTRPTCITSKRTPALAGGNFHVAIDSIVPKEIDLQSLPSNAEDVAPELRGFGYIVVEELIAIVERPTRKIVVVFPRWAEQHNNK